MKQHAHTCRHYKAVSVTSASASRYGFIANLRFNILNTLHWSLPITAHGSGGKESEYMALVRCRSLRSRDAAELSSDQVVVGRPLRGLPH